MQEPVVILVRPQGLELGSGWDFREDGPVGEVGKLGAWWGGCWERVR